MLEPPYMLWVQAPHTTGVTEGQAPQRSCRARPEAWASGRPGQSPLLIRPWAQGGVEFGGWGKDPCREFIAEVSAALKRLRA